MSLHEPDTTFAASSVAFQQTLSIQEARKYFDAERQVLTVEQALKNFDRERNELEAAFESRSGTLRRWLGGSRNADYLLMLRKEYLDVLYFRDQLEDAIRKHQVTTGEMMTQIAEQDEKLRQLTNRILSVYCLDFDEWTHTRQPDPSLWWWNLDNERFNTEQWRQNPIRLIFYTVLALLLIYWNLGVLVSIADRVSNFLIGVFARSNLANIGLDLLTVGAFLVQIVVGGRISLIFAERLTDAINHWVRRYDWHGRRVLTLLAPVTSLFVGTLLFVALLFLISIAVEGVGQQLRMTIDDADKSISERLTLLDLASTLDPSTSRPVDLTRIGIGYEEIGDFEQAQQAYEQALSAEPSLTVTSYLLANLYAETRHESADEMDAINRAALRILDRALNAIEDQKVGKLTLEQLRLSDDDYVPQFEYLLLLTRAKVFFNMGEYGAALDDLIRAERVAVDYDALFIRVDNKPESEIIVPDGMPIPIRVTELYYVQARTCSLLLERTDAPAYRDCALLNWTQVTQLADPRIGREVIWNTQAGAERSALRRR